MPKYLILGVYYDYPEGGTWCDWLIAKEKEEAIRDAQSIMAENSGCSLAEDGQSNQDIVMCEELMEHIKAQIGAVETANELCEIKEWVDDAINRRYVAQRARAAGS